jgi:hypothetical protein
MDSWFFLPFPRYVDFCGCRSGRGENLAGKVFRLIQDRLSDAEFCKNRANLSNQFAATANRRFEFKKSRQLFVGAHNKALSVVTMCVCNPDRSPARIDG